ncbi:hypothetical protein GCK32_006656 [Trichostrongylus colubriformis]|uniref:Uncharacterized protein n=1 Tax=Trichostrongylus colubriformis TaxID=6319 RepID=A0AAN8FMQ4_TRICO
MNKTKQAASFMQQELKNVVLENDKLKETLQLKTDEANQLSASLQQAREELSDVIRQNEELKTELHTYQTLYGKLEKGTKEPTAGSSNM